MTIGNIPGNEIKKIVNKAKEHVMYKDLYKHIKTDDFSKIPFLEEQHIRNAGFSLLKNENECTCVYFTSGTTSEPKAIYYNANEIKYIADYIKWFCEIEGIAGNQRVAVLMGQSFWGAGYFAAQGHIKAGNMVTPIDTGLSKRAIADLIGVFRPTVISSTPSFLLGLKDVLKNTRLKLIETTGEVLSRQTRNKLEKYFKVKVFDAYGLTEGIVGTECSCHDGYHFLPDRVYLEIIDSSTGELLKDGDWGELVMTVICDSVMPIIRYKTGDICKISKGKCCCGQVSPKIWIKGRKEKTIFLYEGAKVGFKELKAAILEVFGASIEFQVNVETNKNMSILQIEISDDDPEKIKSAETKITNINYETIYLAQVGKLSIVFNNKKTLL
ncbi:MAG: AMP-binding protein [Minisyncoccales bacterium]